MAVWAFLSDIHGNAAALERAIALARERGAERFACLGDLLGRGDSARCVALVRDVAGLSVAGNRDFDWQDRVDPATRAYVAGLPREATAADFLAVHGDSSLTPGLGSGDLRRGFGGAYARLRESGRRLLVFGHTHHARLWTKDGPDARPVLHTASCHTLDPAPGRIAILNVGSLGLPFAGKGPAGFALYDPDSGRIEQVVLPPRR